jgi:hypothetical protein
VALESSKNSGEDVAAKAHQRYMRWELGVAREF